jgi:hypothetical protein
VVLENFLTCSLKMRNQTVQDRGDELTPEEAYAQAAKTNRRVADYEKIISKSASCSLLYALKVCKGAFPAGEKVIKEDPFNAWLYCRDVIKCRWHDAEEKIQKDPHSAFHYCIDLMGGERWLEAEEHIVKSPVWAGAYAEKVIKGRWEAAEDRIAKDEDAAEDYYRFVIKGNWKGWTDEQISISTVWMYFYAKKLGFMLPEKMHEYMMKRRSRKEEYVLKYIKEFCK